MSVEQIVMATITGPEKLLDTAIERLIINRQFHPENAIKAMAGTKKLLPLDIANPYSETLSKSMALASEFGITPDYRDFSAESYEPSQISGQLEEISQQLVKNNAQMQEMTRILQNATVVSEQLSHFESFDVELSSLFQMRYLKFRFGRIPAESHREVVRRLGSRPDVYYFDSGNSEHWIYGGYFALPMDYSRVDSIFASLGFERIHIDLEDNTESTVNQEEQRLREQAKQAEQSLKELEAERKKLIADNSEGLLKMYSWLRFKNECYSLRAYAGAHHGKFYMVGWIPEEGSKEFSRECESYGELVCTLTLPKDRPGARPPVKLKKGFISGIYQPFVEMYGLPAYGELDPRLFMAITYTLLFGIMFGDIGQGVLLIISGLLLWKLKKMWLGRIVALCGVSATAFGAVYGSIFGNEHLLPGFKVLEDGNTMKILIVAVAVGVVLILACMILNIITGIRQKDIKKIFFEPNGLAGFVLYTGIAAGAVLKIVKGVSVFTPLYIIAVIALPLFLIFAATPVTKLVTGQKDWLPKSVGMFIVEGFFELFETLLSYVSNTVSFLRVGAFAISHAGMMMVVYLLSAGADGGYSIGGLIFGNLLVTGLETVLVCIQVMRLEFYEMFGRFYQSGGVSFKPAVVNYKAAN